MLVGIVACAIISLIPSLGWAGAISTRALSCALVGVQVIHSLKSKEDKGVILLQIMRLATVAIGLAGVAAHLNGLVIGALAADIFFQMAGAGKGAQQRDIIKSLSHMSFILVDTFAMVALLAGGWPFAVTAAAISSAVMFAFAAKAIYTAANKREVDYESIADAILYIALGGIGLAGAIRAGELLRTEVERYHYSYTNDTDHTVSFYDKNGDLITQAEPGETISFDVNPDKTTFIGGGCGGSTPGVIFSDAGPSNTPFFADRADYITVVVQKPMTTEEFPNLPLGGSSVAIEGPSSIEAE